MNGFIIEVSEQQIRIEKDKARVLKKSRWWHSRIAAGLCQYCGETFDPAELTMDHILPIIRGGKSSRSNIVPCCKECNSRKKYLLPMEWDDFMKRSAAGGGDGDI